MLVVLVAVVLYMGCVSGDELCCNQTLLDYEVDRTFLDSYYQLDGKRKFSVQDYNSSYLPLFDLLGYIEATEGSLLIDDQPFSRVSQTTISCYHSSQYTTMEKSVSVSFTNQIPWTLTYEKMKSTVLFWDIEGKWTLSFRTEFDFTVDQTTDMCELNSWGTYAYRYLFAAHDFIPTNMPGWFFSGLIKFTLNYLYILAPIGYDLETAYLPSVQTNIVNNFVKIWCVNHKMFP